MKGIGWFSGGVTSAVAIKMALELGYEVDIIYFETGAHHPDHDRFLKDCEKWYGQKILTIRNKRYKSPIDVVLKDKFINSPGGARCTLKLKKEMRFHMEKVMNYDFQIMGFDYHEPERAQAFSDEYPYAKPVYPLIEKGLSKPDCLRIIQEANIEIPMMYKLGYNNSNCIGCVKGGMGYWNKVRRDFPEVFDEMARAERAINNSCLKKQKTNKTTKKRTSVKLFLDQLDPEAGRHDDISLPECGVFCSVESPLVNKIIRQSEHS